MSIVAALGILLSVTVGVLFGVQWALAARSVYGPRGRWRRRAIGFVPADLDELGRRFALVEDEFRRE